VGDVSAGEGGRRPRTRLQGGRTEKRELGVKPCNRGVSRRLSKAGVDNKLNKSPDLNLGRRRRAAGAAEE